jgi:hypothetical protein
LSTTVEQLVRLIECRNNDYRQNTRAIIDQLRDVLECAEAVLIEYIDTIDRVLWDDVSFQEPQSETDNFLFFWVNGHGIMYDGKVMPIKIAFPGEIVEDPDVTKDDISRFFEHALRSHLVEIAERLKKQSELKEIATTNTNVALFEEYKKSKTKH